MFMAGLSQMPSLSGETPDVEVWGAASSFSQVIVLPTWTVRFSSVKSIIGDLSEPVASGRTAMGLAVADGWASTVGGCGVAVGPCNPRSNFDRKVFESEVHDV